MNVYAYVLHYDAARILDTAKELSIGILQREISKLETK